LPDAGSGRHRAGGQPVYCALLRGASGRQAGIAEMAASPNPWTWTGSYRR